MTEKEQIEEIARVICPLAKETNMPCWRCAFSRDCTAYKYAENLYTAGYQKIPKNAVIFTEEEYIDLSRNYVKEQMECASKETVKKILNELLQAFPCDKNYISVLKYYIKSIAIKHGVEDEIQGL